MSVSEEKESLCRKEKAGFSGNRFLLYYTRCMKFIFCTAMLVLLCCLLPEKKVSAAPVKVVIDPGHGGEEKGAEYGIYTEKLMTMVVAKAMKEELEKYDGIEVYLTRTEDVQMSLQERADYAKSVGADFLFCIHFNASDLHNLYGAEVWCSAYGKCYTEGRRFGEMCLDELCTLGIYRRGVKLRLSEKEEEKDYYGIIRHSVEYNIPSVIIEHCHMDNKEDLKYFNTMEGMKKLGVLDATAVAKYFGLSSNELNVSYKGYPRPDVESMVKPDSTEPKNVSLTCLRVKKDTGEAELLLTGEDKESGILYYACSLDGGNTYGALQRWENAAKEMEFVINLPKDKDIDLRYMVYNGYDLTTESDIIHIDALDGTVKKDVSGKEGSVSGNDVSENGVSENEPEALETMAEGGSSGIVHEIDMERYKNKEEKTGISLLEETDFSAFILLMVLGMLIALLAVLLIVRSAAVKKQRKTRYRGRKR